MADQGGVSKITSGAVAPQRSTELAQSAQRKAPQLAGQGAGRREVPNAASRQVVNIEGRQLNRTAPRGTYLNILV